MTSGSLQFEDRALPLLPQLTDPDWAMAFCIESGVWQDQRPLQLVPHYFRHDSGRRAVVSYTADWGEQYWMGDDEFAIMLEAGVEAPRLFSFPEDPLLPGLKAAASPADAQDLLARFVQIRPSRTAVRVLRYRPTTRAVLRYLLVWPRGQIRKAELIGRVVRPDRVDRWLNSHGLMSHSGFLLPEPLGVWSEGGTIWMDKVPGPTLRKLIHDGAAPSPDSILDKMAPLWEAPVSLDEMDPIHVLAGFERSLNLMRQVLAADALEPFASSFARLREFAESWRPSTPAHNDFYDDQILMPANDRPAIVDFEEAGAGDPLLDVGNFLAHLRWRSHSEGSSAVHYADYHRTLRASALHHFGWSAKDLALREGFALLRLSSNPVRNFRDQAQVRVTEWLTAMRNALEEHP
jgi:hypothetical protein